MIALAAVLLAFVRPVGRLVFFLIGLIFFGAVAHSPIGRAGLHGEGFLLAIPGLLLCLAAILGDIAARCARWLGRRRPDRL